MNSVNKQITNILKSALNYLEWIEGEDIEQAEKLIRNAIKLLNDQT